MGIALVCLWFSHYILGFTSPLADNISANVIGLGLGTIFRFWSYRRWVFPKPSTDVRDVPGDDTHTLPIDVNHERT
jgi:putative flippase GtrA